MKSGRQRCNEIKQRRGFKRAHEAFLLKVDSAKARARFLRDKVVVNPVLLRPTNSYETPEFVQRGYYVDRGFTCKDCGVKEGWTATQQKWWYEVAHGDVWTAAVRCRRCRRKERTRKAEARKASEAGRAGKIAR